jgi:nucleotide-binding universal stress UspA family protein
MQPRILVPIDDSPEARRAVKQAIELALPLRAGVVLMTGVVTPMLPRDLLDTAQLTRLTARFREAGERVLADLRQMVEASGVAVETKCVEGSPADEIVAEAGRGYMFIVMGAHGAGLAGRERMLLGSVSDRVLRQSPIPVLIIPDVAVSAQHAVE